MLHILFFSARCEENIFFVRQHDFFLCLLEAHGVPSGDLYTLEDAQEALLSHLALMPAV
jgi:hypothetical protein